MLRILGLVLVLAMALGCSIDTSAKKVIGAPDGGIEDGSTDGANAD